MCSLFHCIDKKSRKRKNESLDATISFSLSIEVKDVTVRIIHAGGKQEIYHNVIPASQVMQRYPGMRVASPDIFKRPHESVLSADDKLVPGEKYFLIPSTTVWKLKRKHSRKKKVKLARIEESVSDSNSNEVTDTSEDFSDDSMCSAKDFYISRDNWSNSRLQKSHKEKKSFAPPIRKPRTSKGFGWEPGLPSIEEISP